MVSQNIIILSNYNTTVAKYILEIKYYKNEWTSLICNKCILAMVGACTHTILQLFYIILSISSASVDVATIADPMHIAEKFHILYDLNLLFNSLF